MSNQTTGNREQGTGRRDSPDSDFAFCLSSPLTTRHSPLPRSGFTLVELLVVMVIIGILTSLVLGALIISQESANRSKTESIITKLDTQLAHRWESYKTRRIQLDSTLLGALTAGDRNGLAALRTQGIYELIRLEMPQRWEDITDDPTPTAAPAVAVDPIVLASVPAVSTVYLRAFNQVHTNTGSWPSASLQHAECLYLILTIGGVEDESFAEQVGNLDVGDTDDDGMKEFLDAWGNPIGFIRAATGFQSLRQTRNAKAQHDPFDSMHQFEDNFAFYPLIFSGGPDGIRDLAITNPTDPSPAPPVNEQYNDPFDKYTTGGVTYLHGEPFDDDADGEDNSVDNIYNHNLQVR